MLLIPPQYEMEDIKQLDTFRAGFNEAIGEDVVNLFQGNRYWDYMMGFIQGDFNDEDIVLDIGGGFSHFMVYLAPYIKAGIIIDNASFTWTDPTFWDWYKTLFEYPVFRSGKLSVLIWDAVSLPFPNNFFTKVVSFSALEHFGKENDTAAAQEIWRVLKPNGLFTGTVDFNLMTENPSVDGNPYTYTYESFFRRIIKPSGLKLCDRFEPFKDNSNRVDYVSTLFFKLAK